MDANADAQTLQTQLSKFKIDEYSPFGGSPADAVTTILRQLTGLTTFIDVATGTDEVNELVPHLKSKAMEGVHSLTALAYFFAQDL